MQLRNFGKSRFSAIYGFWLILATESLCVIGSIYFYKIHSIKIASLLQKHKLPGTLPILVQKLHNSSRHKIVRKIAYLGEKNCLSRSKKSNHQECCLSQCKKTAQVISKSRAKIVHLDLRYTEGDLNFCVPGTSLLGSKLQTLIATASSPTAQAAFCVLCLTLQVNHTLF